VYTELNSSEFPNSHWNQSMPVIESCFCTVDSRVVCLQRRNRNCGRRWRSHYGFTGFKFFFFSWQHTVFFWFGRFVYKSQTIDCYRLFWPSSIRWCQVLDRFNQTYLSLFSLHFLPLIPKNVLCQQYVLYIYLYEQLWKK